MNIPESPRLLTTARKKSSTTGSLFYKHREEETVKQAKDIGYFVVPTCAFIASHYAVVWKKRSVLDDEPPVTDITRLALVNFAHMRLHSVGDIGTCGALTVCDLSQNYITQFDALITCTRLVKLDLHANQISSVPGHGFWSCLRRLRVLHLHDNPLSDMQNLHFMSAGCCLEFLTLYDTPLSLRHSYRHHVVNTIYTVKALDEYVVSDEEVIEDTQFGGRFAALSPPFEINLTCKTAQVCAGIVGELDAIRVLIKTVNVIMAHHSPVLILQRHIRGFLTRCHLQQQAFPKLWAGHILGGRTVRGQSSAPPPSSPTSLKGSPYFHSSTLDFDTYLMNRRPGSRIADSDRDRNSSPELKEKRLLAREQHKLVIDIDKLQRCTLKSLHREALLLEMNNKLVEVPSSVRDESNVPRESRPQTDTDEDDHISNYRLRGLRKDIQQYDPLIDMIISRRESGMEMRAFSHCTALQTPAQTPVCSHCTALQTPAQPTAVKKSSCVLDGRERSERRFKSGIDLLPLRAVAKAYADRAHAEQHAVRVAHVSRARAHRQRANERTRMVAEERRDAALQARDVDRKREQALIDLRSAQKARYLQVSQDRRRRSAENASIRCTENSFMADFNAQNASLARTLQQHDQRMKADADSCSCSDVILARAESEAEKQELVRTYLEHRQLMRHTDTAMSRASMDVRLLKDANDRLLQARVRVAQCKARAQSVESASRMLPNLCVMETQERHIEMATQGRKSLLRKWGNKLNRKVSAEA